MPLRICCCAVAEPTVRAAAGQLCFKFVYFLNVLALPIFLIWMVVATRPIDQRIFGPEEDRDVLSGDVNFYDGSVKVIPTSLETVPLSQLRVCGPAGEANWELQVIATKQLAGGTVPVVLASTAMTKAHQKAPDSPELKWHAVAQPSNFGSHVSLTGPSYETPVLNGVGCSNDQVHLGGQNELVVCVSSHPGGASSVDDCDLVRASCHGGIAGWFANRCTDGVQLVSHSGMDLQKCPLRPKGICEQPLTAVDCSQCKTFGCRPGQKSPCDKYTMADCLKENPSADFRSMPRLQIIFHNIGNRSSHDYTLMVGKTVTLFLGDGKQTSTLWSSDKDEPKTQLAMSDTMQARAKPKWCFGPRLQSFYLVVCLTSSSGSNGKLWDDRQPPLVDGPPFNDRCSALLGLCGTEGAPGNLPAEYCTSAGTIPMGKLVKPITGRRNPMSFWFCGFALFMVLAHVSTLVTYFGGLFRTGYIDDAVAVVYGQYTRCTGWDQLKAHKHCMGQLGAIVLWGASKSEERLFILRNWVGRAAAIPHWDVSCSGTGPDWRDNNSESHVLGRLCHCVDVFMDEGHRPGARELWEAFVAFLQTGPPRSFVQKWAQRLLHFSFDDAKSTGQGEKGDPFKGLNHLLQQREPGRNPFASFPPGQPSFQPEHNPYASFGQPSFQSVHNNPYASFAERAEPLRGTPDPFEPRGDEYGVELSKESVEKLCTLMDVFRDPSVTENLEARQEDEDCHDKTEDVVVQRRVERCSGSVEYLYVARARERKLPKAACRVLRQQHRACLHLPYRHEESPAQAELPHVVKRLVGLLYVVKRPFDLANRQGVSVQPHTVWRMVVRVIEEEEENPQSAVVKLEWFAICQGRTGATQGQVERALLDDPMSFQPLVPGSAKLSPWEIGRRCAGTVVGLTETHATLDNLNTLLEWLSYDPQIIQMTGCRQQQQGAANSRMIQLERHLAEPLCGSRGKGGAQNHAVNLLRYRGLLDPPACDGPATASHAAPLSYLPEGTRQCPPVSMGGISGSQATKRPSLFTIVDARHMLQEEFFQEVLPTFFRRVDDGYELDERVAFAQVPQTFSQIELVDDSLDVNNNMMFNMLNTIRDNCGAVTSCGTNSTWQLPATDDKEFFDARTKIEDTASSHEAFLRRKRSVYVKARCVMGIAKRNARYLGAVARWSEGAVQLYWVTLFQDRAMLPMLLCKLGYMFLIFAVMLFFHWKPQDQYLFCPGGVNAGLCGRLTQVLDDPSGQWIHVFEGAAVWTAIALVLLVLFELARVTWGATEICRRVVMLDNLTYFWSTSAAFFWVLLNFYMIVSGEVPFSYEIRGWMYWLIFIKALQYILTYSMKFKGDCREGSIWRAQQMFFVTAPLHQLSILLGTKGAFDIWRGLDKSFWDSDNWKQVLCLVRAWLSFIVGSTVVAVVVVPLALIVNAWNVTAAMLSATVILVFMGITVFDAWMDVWDLTAKVQRTAKVENARGFHKCWVWICRFGISMREWTWVVRWLLDFGMPILVLLVIQESSFGIAAAFSFLARL